ncbi:MAG: hypothetical protein WC241_05225 [Candidatus Paceibacterota bacterium]|jgi:hypothetical protein
MQNQNFKALLVGIISGILTTVIIYTIVSIFKRILLPWYQELIYRGLDINGEWREKQVLANGIVIENVINLKQKGHKLSGTVTVIKKFPKKEDSEIKIFDIKGNFYDRLVSASCKNSDRKSIGCYNILLEVMHGGKEMVGSFAWYDVGTNRIFSADTKWVRAD